MQPPGKCLNPPQTECLSVRERLSQDVCCCDMVATDKKERDIDQHSRWSQGGQYVAHSAKTQPTSMPRYHTYTAPLVPSVLAERLRVCLYPITSPATKARPNC